MPPIRTGVKRPLGTFGASSVCPPSFRPRPPPPQSFQPPPAYQSISPPPRSPSPPPPPPPTEVEYPADLDDPVVDLGCTPPPPPPCKHCGQAVSKENSCIVICHDHYFTKAGCKKNGCHHAHDLEADQRIRIMVFFAKHGVPAQTTVIVRSYVLRGARTVNIKVPPEFVTKMRANGCNASDADLELGVMSWPIEMVVSSL